VLELAGDLGSGKTTFVRGLARGTGSSNQVASPTFTLSRQYAVPPAQGRTLRTIYHFDFYRLDAPGVMADELAEVVGDKASVVVVEWSDIVTSVLPDERVTINLEASGEASRTLAFRYPEALAYLIPKET
jgi:tRNA threonylcarbamoyladenosine biosynthesis protein TsaE